MRDTDAVGETAEGRSWGHALEGPLLRFVQGEDRRGADQKTTCRQAVDYPRSKPGIRNNHSVRLRDVGDPRPEGQESRRTGDEITPQMHMDNVEPSHIVHKLVQQSRRRKPGETCPWYKLVCTSQAHIYRRWKVEARLAVPASEQRHMVASARKFRHMGSSDA